jgi:hypothetical protein
MAKGNAFINDVEAVLLKIGGLKHNLGAATSPLAAIDALYEAFLYFRIVSILRPLASSFTAKLHNNKFVVRFQHGEMKTTHHKFSYVRFKIKSNYELHIDTFVNTRAAGARLETDIAVFTATVCDNCRGGTQRPAYSSLWMFVEAKHFTKSVSTTVAKGFMGTWSMLGRPKRSSASLVANRSIDKNAVRLVEGGGCRSYGQVLPLKSCQKFVKAWTSDTRAALKKF